MGTAKFGNGTTTVHRRIAAAALSARPSRIRIVQSDPDRVGYTTGAFGGAGTMVAEGATQDGAPALADAIIDFTARLTGGRRQAAAFGDADATGARFRQMPFKAGGMYRVVIDHPLS